MRWKTTIIVLALAALASSVWLVAAQKEARPRSAAAGQPGGAVGPTETSGQPLPAHSITDTGGREVAPEELSRGRVLLVYLTTQCRPCVEQVEIISRLHAANPRDLRVLGVSFERPAEVEAFVKERGLKFPVLIDKDARLARALELHYFPTALLLEAGKITKTWRGVTRDESELYRQLGAL